MMATIDAPPLDEALLMGAAAQDNSFLGHMQLVELGLLRHKADFQAIPPQRSLFRASGLAAAP
jgi:hypothetical protein